MGRADYLALGDYNAVCYVCGRKFKASMLKRHWQGYYVCEKDWEPRQPQDFVRGKQDDITPPWVQPRPSAEYVAVCDIPGSTGMAGNASAGCSRAGVVKDLTDYINLIA